MQARASDYIAMQIRKINNLEKRHKNAYWNRPWVASFGVEQIGSQAIGKRITPKTAVGWGWGGGTDVKQNINYNHGQKLLRQMEIIIIFFLVVNSPLSRHER